jgi:hypothetical protein
VKTPPGFPTWCLGAFAAVPAELDFLVDQINLFGLGSSACSSFQDRVYSGIYYSALSIAAHNGHDFQVLLLSVIPLFHIQEVNETIRTGDGVQSRDHEGAGPPGFLFGPRGTRSLTLVALYANDIMNER